MLTLRDSWKEGMWAGEDWRIRVDSTHRSGGRVWRVEGIDEGKEAVADDKGMVGDERGLGGDGGARGRARKGGVWRRWWGKLPVPPECFAEGWWL